MRATSFDRYALVRWPIGGKVERWVSWDRGMLDGRLGYTRFGYTRSML